MRRSLGSFKTLSPPRRPSANLVISQTRTFESREHNVARPAAPNWTMHDQTDENRIRLVVLDDHGLFRASLERLLASEVGFEVVGECGTSAEALEMLNGSPVDVVLLDFALGAEHANDLISAARKAGYQGRFLIVAGTTDAERSANALKFGASGIFLKSEAPERLVQAIKLIASPAAHWKTASKERSWASLAVSRIGTSPRAWASRRVPSRTYCSVCSPGRV